MNTIDDQPKIYGGHPFVSPPMHTVTNSYACWPEGREWAIEAMRLDPTYTPAPAHEFAEGGCVVSVTPQTRHDEWVMAVIHDLATESVHMHGWVTAYRLALHHGHAWAVAWTSLCERCVIDPERTLWHLREEDAQCVLTLAYEEAETYLPAGLPPSLVHTTQTGRLSWDLRGEWERQVAVWRPHHFGLGGGSVMVGRLRFLQGRGWFAEWSTDEEGPGVLCQRHVDVLRQVETIMDLPGMCEPPRVTPDPLPAEIAP